MRNRSFRPAAPRLPGAAVGCAAIGSLLLCAGSASAAWTVAILNPSGSPYAHATSSVGTQQGGAAQIGSVVRASLWSGSAASRQDFHPSSPSVLGSWMHGTSSALNRQAGYTLHTGNVTHAARWDGSAGSWFDLHPAGASRSEATGVDVNIAGFAVIGGESHAYMWVGASPGVSVDLNPAGAIRSTVRAIANNASVGSATFSGNARAGIWSTGSSLSWIDLNPPSATTSIANGIEYSFSAFQVVGSATFSGNARAGLWNSLDPSSWVDLNPSGATTSTALATFGGWQVGATTFSGTSRASLWNGTAASWEDLSLALPGSWSMTVATGIWSDGTTQYISGHGLNLATNNVEAILWTQPIPTPGAAGLLGVGGLIALRRRRV